MLLERTYLPTLPPNADPTSFEDLRGLTAWMRQENYVVADALRNPVVPRLHVAPKKPHDGLIALADGANWDPGNGRGLYYYDEGAGIWRILPSFDVDAYLLSAENLADLPDASVARDNLAIVANPTATIGLTPVNGSSNQALRRDGAPALSQAIAPTWSDKHIWTAHPSGAYLNLFGSPRVNIYSEGNENALVALAVNDLPPGTASYPTGGTLGGVLKAGSAGNTVFGLFAPVWGFDYGVITHEINAFNYKAQPPGTYPVNRGIGISHAMPIVLTLAPGGDYRSEIVLHFAKEGSDPQQANTGLFMDADVIRLTAIYIDATATDSPIESALLKNSGQGSNIHLRLQTKGAHQAANYAFEHLNAAGTRTWGITQGGSVFVGSGAVINWNSGDVTLTHAANLLTFAGGGYIFSAPDGGASLIFAGASRGIRFGYSGTASSIEGVDNTGVTTYQPLIVGGASVELQASPNSRIKVDGTGVGFFGTAPVAKPTVTGSRGGNAALASALTALASYGLLTDSSSA